MKNESCRINRLVMFTVIYSVIIITLNIVFEKLSLYKASWCSFIIISVFMLQVSCYIYMDTDETFIGEEFIWKKYWGSIIEAFLLYIPLLIVAHLFDTDYKYLRYHIPFILSVVPLVRVYTVLIKYWFENKGGISSVILDNWHLEPDSMDKKYTLLLGYKNKKYYSFRLRSIDAYKLNFEKGDIGIDFYNKTNRVVKMSVIDG